MEHNSNHNLAVINVRGLQFPCQSFHRLLYTHLHLGPVVALVIVASVPLPHKKGQKTLRVGPSHSLGGYSLAFHHGGIGSCSGLGSVGFVMDRVALGAVFSSTPGHRLTTYDHRLATIDLQLTTSDHLRLTEAGLSRWPDLRSERKLVVDLRPASVLTGTS
jgi:hypothetical protein